MRQAHFEVQQEKERIDVMSISSNSPQRRPMSNQLGRSCQQQMGGAPQNILIKKEAGNGSSMSPLCDHDDA
jgi:hypothetical protein